MAKTEEYKILISADTQKAIGGVKNLASSFKALGAAVVATGVVAFGKQIIDASKKMQTYRNQLRLVTKDQADLERLMGRLTTASINNRTSFEATAELFQKLAVSTGDLGKSEDQLIKVTGKLSQALAVAGADAGTTNGVIRQFGQAMASGMVRGDEFNSIVEGLGPALAIMAKESGLNVGELRKLAQSGKLTAEVFFNLLENSNALSAAFNSMQVTTEQLETQLGDSYTAFLENKGITEAYEGVIKGLIRTLDQLSGRQGAVANMTNEQLLGFENTSLALEEMTKRLKEAEVANRYTISPESRKATQEVVDQYKALVKQLTEKLRKDKEAAAEAKRLQEAYDAEVKQINELLGANKQLVTQYKSMDLDQFLTPLEKAKKKYDDAKLAVQNLSLTMEVLNQEGLTNTHMYGSIEKALNNAKVAQEAYGKQLQEAIEDQKAKNAEMFKEQQLQKASNELTYLGLRLATETDETYKARIQNLINYKNNLKSIQEAELDGVITTENAAKLRLDAEQAYTEGYKQLAKDRLEADKQANLQMMRDFLNAEQKKRDELLLTREYQFRQAGMSAETAKKAAENMQAYEEDKTKFVVGQLADQFKALGAHNKQAFEAYKAFAIAQAIMDTYKMATSAYAAMVGIPFVGPVLAVGAAAAAIATGMSNVQAIRSQQYSGRQFGGPVTGGSTYIVGENGPEVFTARENGRINPGNMSAQPVNVTFNIEAVDAVGVDQLLLERRGLITSIIREATETSGMRSAF